MRTIDRRRIHNPRHFPLLRIISTFILLMSINLTVTAQNEKKLTPFGLKAGLNRSVINGKELDGTATGFIGLELYVSFFIENELNKKWRFENEILFSFTDDYHFIEIPLRLKYLIHKKIFLTAGPKLDFVLNNDDEIYDFNNFGVSVEMGMQYELTKRIISEFRYSHGLLPQINDFALDIYDGKRNTIRLGLGYRF
ncbi:MAG: porin family protein [Cyclobacteriaceae bacterium]|nr:porin family protein [Cyclobacteriaceae bacterium]